MQPKTVHCPFVQSLSKVSTLKTMHQSKSLIVTLVPTKVTGHFFVSFLFHVFGFLKKKTCKQQSGHSEKPHFEASVLVFGHQHVYCQNFIWMISLANKLLNS